MRVIALYVAVVLLAVAVLVPEWAHTTKMPMISVDLRHSTEFHGGSTFTVPLRKLDYYNDPPYDSLANEGMAAFVLLVAAAIASGAASELLRRRRLAFRGRLLFALVPLAALIATLVFANALAGLWPLKLELGSPPWIASLGAVLALGALATPGRDFWRPR